ncbi:MAG: chemotaxis protein CheW [Chloroflexota bacterium]
MADDAERQLVVFDLANEVYGVDIGTVREIIRMQTVTFVPDAPEFVQGVINLRGRVIPVVNLRKRFGLPVAEATPDSRVLVVDIAGNDIGVIVDAVTEVQRVAEALIEPPAALVTTEGAHYIDGIARVDTRLLILLDLERALGAAVRRATEQESESPVEGVAA